MEFRLLKRKKANKKGRMHEAIISVHCLQYIIHTCSSSGFKTRQKIPLSCAVQSTYGDSNLLQKSKKIPVIRSTSYREQEANNQK